MTKKAGRPSKYDPRFCEEVIAAGREGLSLTAFAGKIGVNRDTLSQWSTDHPEFAEAKKDHAAARTLFLEQGLLEAKSSPIVTSRIFALKNAAPHEWREKQVIQHDVNLTIMDLVAGSYKDGDARAPRVIEGQAIKQVEKAEA